ncbi:tRNA-5-taurinomethyluridine 2-sulfurtransferase [Pycnococcus provasolii]
MAAAASLLHSRAKTRLVHLRRHAQSRRIRPCFVCEATAAHTQQELSEEANPQQLLDTGLAFAGCLTTSPPQPKRIAVLLSGGVDSSVALHLLKRAGHEVTAFYLKIWFQEDFRNTWNACPWEEDLEFAQAAAKLAGVEVEVVPLTDAYWDRVVAHAIHEVQNGRTPNPDVLCNSRVKFGAFLEHVQNDEREFEYVASGHYARVEHDPNKMRPSRLLPCADNVKDQTYFLSQLTQAQLSRVLFPLSHLSKAQVRTLATSMQIPAADRKDSQGICFLGKVPWNEFVKEHCGTAPGPIVERETGDVLGEHNGVWFHTIGQRRGLRLSGGPWYVVEKDIGRRVVYVSRQYHDEAYRGTRRTVGVREGSWVEGEAPPSGEVLLKVRHGPERYRALLTWRDNNARDRGVLRLLDDVDDQGLAPGQFAVLYECEEPHACLGGGVMEAYSDD